METLVKMSGVPEDILNILVARGYFKTKTEAMRAGILELGKEFNLLSNPKELELELVAIRIAKQEAERKPKEKNISRKKR